MKKYRTDSRCKIEEIEVLKETDNFVMFNNRFREIREMKHTSWNDWFDTRQEAVKFILDRFDKKINSLEERIANELNDKQKFLDSLPQTTPSE